jgi:hypothetical protein
MLAGPGPQGESSLNRVLKLLAGQTANSFISTAKQQQVSRISAG